MNLTVNGIAHEVDRLRARRRSSTCCARSSAITGPKAGCHQGGCGACTVLVDGEPRRSCLLARRLRSTARRSRRSKGSARPRTSRRSSRRSSHHYAAQCGFCTSGMMLAAQAYIDRGGTDDAEAIQEALAGHVCRCTGYVEDHRRRRGGGARRLVRPDDDGRREAHDDGELEVRHEGRRRATPPLRRRRARHRADDVRRRRARPRHALGEGASLARTTTRGSRSSTRRRPRRCRASTPSSRGRTSRCSSTATSPRSASRPTSRCSRRTRCATWASRSRSSRPRARSSPQAAVDAIEVDFEERPALFDIRQAFDADAPKIHQWGNWYPHFEGEMDRRQIRKGDIDGGLRRTRTRSSRASTARRRSSTRRSRRRSARSCPSRTAG